MTMSWINWPNRITIARITLVAPFAICLLNLNAPGWTGWRHLALAIFVLMAISDALDGFLARTLHEETPLGRFLDPVGDKLLITCSVVLLAMDASSVPGFILPSWVAVIAIGKDVLTVVGFGIIYASTGQFFIQPRIWGKSCTAMQLAMIGFCLLAPNLPEIAQQIWPPLCWTASGLAVVALIDYIGVGNRFAANQNAHAQE
jgi:CDP-diacylglycerol--glycerol-3-phosphate 3-phosphatidyltransferase